MMCVLGEFNWEAPIYCKDLHQGAYKGLHNLESCTRTLHAGHCARASTRVCTKVLHVFLSLLASKTPSISSLHKCL